MPLRIRLSLLFGGLLLFVMVCLAAVLYWQIRSSFIQRSVEQVHLLARYGVDRGERHADRLRLRLTDMAGDAQIVLAIREAGRGGSAQRRLIDLLQVRTEQGLLAEITVISPDGVALARGHRPAEFGDTTDAKGGAPESFYLSPDGTRIHYRQPVRLGGREVGTIDGAVDLTEDIEKIGNQFSGSVRLKPHADGPEDPVTPSATAGIAFEFVAVQPWILPDKTTLADFVFHRIDHESRGVFQKLSIRVGAIFLATAAIGGFFIFRLADTVTRPIRKLARASADLSSGSRSLDLPSPAGDEIGDLTGAFSKMASTLDESRHKLLAAERLAAWQDAARMMAHEIKNPLSPIKTVATTISRAARDKDPALAALAERSADMVLNEIAHLEKLLSEFSQFARFPAPQIRPGNLVSTVKSVIDEFRQKHKAIVWIEHLDPALPPVRIDAGMFSEVIRNLILNAVDAVQSPAMSRPPAIRVETKLDAPYAVLTVSDSGPGVPAEILPKLFTPYQTTKSSGSGLGLAVSRKIMIEHGGDLIHLFPSPFPETPGAAFRASLLLEAS